MQYQYTCPQCQSTFTSKTKNRRYCSRACHSASLVGKPGYRLSGHTKTCPQCRKVYNVGPKSKQKYCSKACYTAAQHIYQLTTYTCDHCHQQFERMPYENHAGAVLRFCSPDCKKAHIRGERATRWKPNVVLTCEWCKGAFERKPHLSHIRFCSRLCRNHWLRHNIISPTGIELAVEKLLTDHGIAFIPQHQIEKWSCDFYIDAARLVIECDGDYWHQLPRVQYKDRIKDGWLVSQGYRVLHLAERDILSDLPGCYERIKSALTQGL